MCHLPTQSVRNRLRMSSNGIEAVVGERVDQFLDRRRPMVEEIRGEQAAKVGPAHRQQLAHRQTMAWRSDTTRIVTLLSLGGDGCAVLCARTGRVPRTKPHTQRPVLAGAVCFGALVEAD